MFVINRPIVLDACRTQATDSLIIILPLFFFFRTHNRTPVIYHFVCLRCVCISNNTDDDFIRFIIVYMLWLFLARRRAGGRALLPYCVAGQFAASLLNFFEYAIETANTLTRKNVYKFVCVFACVLLREEHKNKNTREKIVRADKSTPCNCLRQLGLSKSNLLVTSVPAVHLIYKN